MPQEERLSSVLEADLWHTYKPIIKRLYIEERKSKRKVKDIMESDYGFPKFTDTTWGDKLLYELRLAKKLKTNDWPVLHEHRRRREAEGKKTDIYLHDMLIPWEKARREIYYRHGAPSELGVLMPLPRGVMLKTPPPPPSPVPAYRGSPRLALMSPRAQGFHITPNISYEPAKLSLETQRSVGMSIDFSAVSASASLQSATFYNQLSLVCLESIPWFALIKMLPKKAGHETTPPYFPLVRDRQPEYPGTTHDRPFTIPTLASNEVGIQFDAFHILARAIYIISNHFAGRYRGCPTEIQLLFTRIPLKLVLDLFDTGLLSTRAAIEGIGRLIPSIEKKDTFISFMKVILTRPAWIRPHGHVYLSSAVSMGSVDIVRSLLNLGVRADQPFQLFDFCYEYNVWPAIYTAVASRNVECLELLVKDCDLNRNILTVNGTNFSNFRLVIFCMANTFTTMDSEFWGRELNFHQKSVTTMLENGADVDLGCGCLSLQSEMEDFFQDNSIPCSGLSLLEHCYYYNKKLYYLLVPASGRPVYGVHKDEICLAATVGARTLRNYLDSKPNINNAFVEAVFAEQFFVSDARIHSSRYGSKTKDPTALDSTIIRGFLEAGVTINTSDPEECFTPLLRLVVQKVQAFGFNKNDEFVIHKLLDSGAVLGSIVLATAVSAKGIATLEFLLSAKADFRREGARALYKAARLNNFRAVSWLLRQGVDINAAVQVEDPWYDGAKSFSVLTAVIVAMRENDEDLTPICTSLARSRMIKYLTDYGAKLWVNSPDSSPFVALRVIFGTSLDLNFEKFERILSILNRDEILKDLPHKGGFLLEILLSRVSTSWGLHGDYERIFEFLLEHNAPANPGAVLARLIYLKAPRELVLSLMSSGADMNTYTSQQKVSYRCNAIQAASKWWDQDLVSVLLEHGGDINAAAHDCGGRTALQYACSVKAYSEEDKRTQITFIRFLFLKNVDINAPPAKFAGYTALQCAAVYGDLELMSLLLGHGAQINAPSHSTTRRALDLAAENGRLDALHFLLKAGALSYCHGRSGYEGAIRLADHNLFTVISDSLRNHVRNNEDIFRKQAGLAAAHRAVMAERSWTDDKFRLEIEH